jgi:mono/diheme cytochrome c family protein
MTSPRLWTRAPDLAFHSSAPLARGLPQTSSVNFEGKTAGGICYTCHGPDAKGTQLAPDLTDQQWLNVDGSYDAIVQVVTTGVPTPKQFPGLMPPFGQMLSPDQVRAVAAYVYSLTHPAPGG